MIADECCLLVMLFLRLLRETLILYSARCHTGRGKPTALSDHAVISGITNHRCTQPPGGESQCNNTGLAGDMYSCALDVGDEHVWAPLEASFVASPDGGHSWNAAAHWTGYPHEAQQLIVGMSTRYAASQRRLLSPTPLDLQKSFS